MERLLGIVRDIFALGFFSFLSYNLVLNRKEKIFETRKED